MKEYLSKKGIKYTEINVGVNHEKAMEMVRISGQMGVPVIMVDDKVVVGFDQPTLDKLLETPHPPPSSPNA